MRKRIHILHIYFLITEYSHKEIFSTILYSAVLYLSTETLTLSHRHFVMSELQCDWQRDGRAAFFQPRQGSVSRAAEKCLRSLYSDMLGWPDRNPLIRKSRHSTLTTPSQVLQKHTTVSDLEKENNANRLLTLQLRDTSTHPALCWILHTDLIPACEIRANGGQGMVNDWVRVYVCTCRMWSPEQCWECWWDLSAWPVTDRQTEEPAQWDMAPLCLLSWGSREFQPAQIVIRSKDTLSYCQGFLFLLSEIHWKWANHWQVPHWWAFHFQLFM